MKLEKEDDLDKDNVGPELLKSKRFEDVTFMKNNKADEIDKVLKVPQAPVTYSDEQVSHEVQKYLKKTAWSKNFTKSIMIPLPKEVNAI